MEGKVLNGKGFAIASLVTGILSILSLTFIIISIVLAICAITFGAIARKRGEKSLSKAGIALGYVSLSITLVLWLFLEVFEASLFVVPSWYK